MLYSFVGALSRTRALGVGPLSAVQTSHETFLLDLLFIDKRISLGF